MLTVPARCVFHLQVAGHHVSPLVENRRFGLIADNLCPKRDTNLVIIYQPTLLQCEKVYYRVWHQIRVMI